MPHRDDIYHVFKNALQVEAAVPEGSRVLAAVSGGLDSVVMLHLLQRFSVEMPLHIEVAHFNHQLRGDAADQDESFVKALCAQWNLACHFGRGDVKSYARDHHLSIEAAAREMRYVFLHRIAKESQCEFILTAHHADDQAETVLDRFVKGAALHGLTGIPFRNGPILRPLLQIDRTAIDAYAQVHHLAYCEDGSNSDLRYHRNRIRHDLLPHLKQYNPQIVEGVNRLARHVREAEAYLEHEAGQALQLCLLHRDREKIILETKAFLSYFNILQKYMLLICWRFLGGDSHHFSDERWRAFFDFLRAGRRDRPLRLGDIQVWLLHGRLVLLRRPDEPHEVRLDDIPGYCALWSGFGFEIKPSDQPLDQIEKNQDQSTVWVDADRLNERCWLRVPRRGDRFQPLKMSGQKRVSQVLAEKHIPLYDRSVIPLFLSGEEIVWVCGVRLDDRFRVTTHSKHLYQLRVERNLESEI